MLPIFPDAMTSNIYHEKRTLVTYVPVSEFFLLLTEKRVMVGYGLICDVLDVGLRDTHAPGYLFSVGSVIFSGWQISKPSVASCIPNLAIVCLGKDPSFFVHEGVGLQS